MGKGNWRPYQDSSLYQLRYFDLIERFGGEDSEDESWCDWNWDIFREQIECALTQSFYKVDRSSEATVPYSNWAQDNLIIFKNELVCIMMDASADAHHVGVAIVPLVSDDNYDSETWMENFGSHFMELWGPGFWKRMGGDQRVRTSAWTSAKV